MRVRQLTAAAAALLLAATLGGCSDGPAPAQPPAPEPVPAPADPTPATGDVRPADRTAVQDGGTLRWAVDRVPATLNVYQPAATADSALLAHALYPSLFRPDEHGRLVPDPDYLAGAESTPPGQQPQVVTYRLNPHAVWSDRTPLSAADLIAQRAALSGLDPAYGSDHPAGYDAIDAIDQGADAGEVRVTFRRPYAEWPSLFGPLYPAAETSSPAAFNRALAGGAHLSAGPFTVSRYDAEGGRVTVERNPLWWGDLPKADRIDFLAVPPEQRLDALDQDRLDIAPLTAVVDRAVPAPATASPSAAAVPPAAAPEEAALALRRAESLPGVTVHRAAAPSLTQLTLNAVRAPLTDPALRLALGRAVDRRRIADAALTPLGIAAAPLGSHLLAGDQEGYRDNSAAGGPVDAARLLDEAGWKRPEGGGTRVKDGKQLALTLLIPAGSATAKRTADALTANLADSGIAVRTVTAPADTFVKDHLATGDYDLALFSWPAGTSPASQQRPVYAKPRPDLDGTLDPGTNYARSGTEEIDRLFDRATAELDPAARLDLLQEADVRIWQLGHSVPLYQRPELVGVGTDVVGAGVWGFGWPRFQDVGWAQD
ncbi:ABC transporter family substrate-binding protein [Kitasatospora aureofaciens]|uniref:ABC transporter family substrate-binding protein n=1 Tax=Kitasatospora aureofaciens TaxID=1894 RepID=UPI001C47BEA9|nr:ABC transporter family substrate-binding protein [Kitasatospora aureofaciens]MBV6700783.1 ABC transporter family substrate-binding protein [Kitasatospora aureofaciens]